MENNRLEMKRQRAALILPKIQPITFLYQTREVLLKEKAQYGWSPCTNKFRSAHFYIEHIIYVFIPNKLPNEEVNCTELSLSVSIPWSNDLAYCGQEKCCIPARLAASTKFTSKICWKGIHKISYDRLTSILKFGVPWLVKINLNG